MNTEVADKHMNMGEQCKWDKCTFNRVDGEDYCGRHIREAELREKEKEIEQLKSINNELRLELEQVKRAMGVE